MKGNYNLIKIYHGLWWYNYDVIEIAVQYL